MANVYTAKSDETLEAVGFYATAPDTEYEVYVFDGDSFREHVENNEKFQTDSGKVLASGVLTDTGFYTVSLEKPRHWMGRNICCDSQDPHAGYDSAGGGGVRRQRTYRKMLT